LHRFIWISVIFLVGCATLDRHENAQQIARSGALTPFSIKANGFVLTSYSRLQDLNQPINVYIEGDGLAWLSRHQASPDPTPKQAVGLALAALDPAKNVMYLARPCQFNDFNQTPCDSAYWTKLRYSEKVIDAMNQALDVFVSKTNHQSVNLIGYSGGAAVAVLLAARRHDIASIRTVAGNLDHAYVNQMHQVDLMPESLNAIDVASSISDITQVHYVGIDDKVIPKQLALRFIAQQKNSRCAVIREVKADHQLGWVAQWPSLLRQSLPC
jgi:hypothetical protein